MQEFKKQHVGEIVKHPWRKFQMKLLDESQQTTVC